MKYNKGLTMKIKNRGRDICRTIIYKSHLIALAVEDNFKLKSPSHLVSDNFSEWGYYKNIAGIPHRYNSEISILCPVTNENITLTKERLMEDHNLLDYIKNSPGVLDNLMALYPANNTLIMGMIYHVSLDEVLNAREGAILNYNESLLLDSEKWIIPEISKLINNILHKVSLPGYIATDNLYGVTTATFIYQAVTLKINELLFATTGRYFISDEAITNSLNSTLYIGGIVESFPRNMKLWLYKNINYLYRHLGKDSTIDLIIENVLTPLRLVCSEIVLSPMNTRYLDNPIHLPNQVKDIPNLFLNNRMEYSRYQIDYAGIESYELIADNKVGEKAAVITSEKAEQTLLMDKGLPERSKHLLLSKKDFESPPIEIKERLLVETALLSLLQSPSSNHNLIYQGRTINFSGKGLFLSLLYYLRMNLGRTDPITEIRFNGIIHGLDTDRMLENLTTDDEGRFYYELMMEDIYNLHTLEAEDVNTVDKAREFVKNSMDIFIKMYGYTTFIGSNIRAANIDLLFKRIREERIVNIEFLLDGGSIEETLLNMGLSIDEEPKEIIPRLIELATDTRLPIDNDNSLLSSATKLMDRLTSYTVNIFHEAENADLLATRSTIGLLGDVLILDIPEVIYDCLGEQSTVTAKGDDSRMDIVIVETNTMDIKTKPSITVPIFSIHNLVDIEIIEPVVVHMK